MSSLVKTALLSVSLVAGIAVAAQAQSDSVASLPPGGGAPVAAAPVGPSVAYPGPNPGSGYYGGTVSQQQPVTPSPKYVGPAPGASDGPMPPRYAKPAGYDADAALHPYTSGGEGPAPSK